MFSPEIRTEEIISGRDAKVYFEIGRDRRLAMWLKNLRARVVMNNAPVNRLGARMAGHKMGMPVGNWTATLFAVTSFFREAQHRIIRTRVVPQMTIISSIENVSGILGRQTTVLSFCKLNEFDVAAVDVDAPSLEEEMSGTFEDYDHPEKLRKTPGE